MEGNGEFEKVGVNRIKGSGKNFYAVWNEATALLKPEFTDITYQTWISTLEPVAITDDTIYLVTANELQKSTVNRLHISQINAGLKAVTGQEIKAVLLLPNEARELLGELSEQDPALSTGGFVHNPKCTFETFVIGESNRFAYAVAETVANSPGSAYNPLLIYGGVGLGKTHLMHAIGHKVLTNNPGANVLYTTSENFTHELITALQAKENNVHYRTKFRKKYRNVDVLMIDDVQFMANKESTQQEFFYTFEDLKAANKQIIITSDKHPREIPGLEERLSTRFEWGIIADVQPPDMETRMAILRRKAELEGRSIPDDVLFYIAEKVVSNIRELESSLNRIIAYSNINKQDINLAMTERTLKDIIPAKKTIVPADIKKVVCEYYGVKPEDLESKRRDTPVVIPRQVAMYLCRELTVLSLAEIGVQFGGKHHTTVLHACEKVEEDMRSSKEFKLTVEDFLKRMR